MVVQLSNSPCPSHCCRLQIPDDVAGASFLALGSAAPEIAISAVATAKITGAAAGAQTGFSLPTIFGSAMIAFGLIPAACTFYIKPGEDWMKLTTWPVIRDTVYYLLCLGYCAYAVSDGQIVLLESAILCALFAVYMLVVYLPAKCCGVGGDKEDSIEEAMLPSNEDSAIERRRSSRSVARDLQQSKAAGDDSATMYGTGSINAPAEDEDEDDEAPEGCLGYVMALIEWIIDMLSVPMNLVFSFTIPDCQVSPSHRVRLSTHSNNVRLSQKDAWENWYMVTFLVATVYVVILSDIVLQFTQVVTGAFGMSPEVAGSTVLALGAQVPDTIASISMARNGMADGEDVFTVTHIL